MPEVRDSKSLAVLIDADSIRAKHAQAANRPRDRNAGRGQRAGVSTAISHEASFPAGMGRSRRGRSSGGDAKADFRGRRVAVTLGLVAALPAEGPKVGETAATTQWSEDYVHWLTKQVNRKLGATGQVEQVRQILAVDALPRR